MRELGERSWRLVAESRIRSLFVEEIDPDPDQGVGKDHVTEPGLVHEFIPHPAPEAFHETIRFLGILVLIIDRPVLGQAVHI